MNVNTVNNASRFAERVAELLEKVEFKRAVKPADREAVYRLQCEVCRRQNLLNARLAGRLYDEAHDDGANGCSTMTLIEGELASTARIHVGADEGAMLPSLCVFFDVITPHLGQGKLVVDQTRLAARLDLSRWYPELPYLSLRPAWMAAQYCNADYIVATTPAEHEGFYRRVCGYQSWSAPREYPQLALGGGCMGLDFQVERKRVEERYPSFKSTDAECEALFGGQLLLRKDRAHSVAGRPSEADLGRAAMAVA